MSDFCLYFDSTSTQTYVRYGSAARLDNVPAFSIVSWIYTTGVTTAGRIMNKANTTTNTGRSLSVSNFVVANGIRFTINRFTTNANADSAANTVVLNTLQFVVGTWEISLGPKIYLGTETRNVAEVSYNSAPVVGTDIVIDESTGDYTIGNRQTSPASAAGFQGFIPWQAYFDRILSFAEMQWLKEHHFTDWAQLGPILLVAPGYEGEGGQPDYSGFNNHGVRTGALLRPFPANILPVEDDRPIVLRDWFFQLPATAAILEQTHYRWRADDGGLEAP